MLKAAVIGVGAMGRNHARIYTELDNIELVAVVDIDELASTQISKTYRVRPYRDHNSMLIRENPDIVSIAVPTNLHCRIALAAINNGSHVLLEKPISDSLSDGKEIVETAKRKGVKLCVGHVERFNPAVILLKQLLDSKALGKIFQLRARRVGPFPDNVKDVGVVLDLATHEIDLIEYLLQSEIESIFAQTRRYVHEEHEDLLYAIFTLSNGVTCSLDINWLSPTKIRELFILGECGLFRLNYLKQDLWFYENSWNGNYIDDRIAFMGVNKGKVLKYEVKKTEPLKAEIAEFIRSIIEDLPPPYSGEDAIRVFEIAQKTLDSSRMGKPIITNCN